MRIKTFTILLFVSILFFTYYKFTLLDNTIVGNWYWVKPTNHYHSFLKNGEAICFNKPLGSWQKVGSHQIYNINWENTWVDKVILIHNLLIGINSNNKIVIAYRTK